MSCEDIPFAIDWGLAQSPADERRVAIDRATSAGIRRDQGDRAGVLEDITFATEWGLVSVFSRKGPYILKTFPP